MKLTVFTKCRYFKLKKKKPVTMYLDEYGIHSSRTKLDPYDFEFRGRPHTPTTNQLTSAGRCQGLQDTQQTADGRQRGHFKQTGKSLRESPEVGKFTAEVSRQWAKRDSTEAEKG